MNFRQPPSPKGGSHRFFRLLSLVLLQHALAPSSTDARSRLPANFGGNLPLDSDSRPYLKITTVLPLRFADALPPPDLTVKPAAGAPPQLAPAASTPVSTVAAPASSNGPAPEPRQPEPENAAVPSSHPGPASANPPAPIIPDDTRPSTRPEDFLPFFQFPGTTSGVNVVVPVTTARPPAPGQQPPSSATYQQK